MTTNTITEYNEEKIKIEIVHNISFHINKVKFDSSFGNDAL